MLLNNNRLPEPCSWAVMKRLCHGGIFALGHTSDCPFCCSVDVNTSLPYRFGWKNHLDGLVHSGNINAKAAPTVFIAICFPLGFGCKIRVVLAHHCFCSWLPQCAVSPSTPRQSWGHICPFASWPPKQMTLPFLRWLRETANQGLFCLFCLSCICPTNTISSRRDSSW